MHNKNVREVIPSEWSYSLQLLTLLKYTSRGLAAVTHTFFGCYWNGRINRSFTYLIVHFFSVRHSLINQDMLVHPCQDNSVGYRNCGIEEIDSQFLLWPQEHEKWWSDQVLNTSSFETCVRGRTSSRKLSWGKYVEENMSRILAEVKM